MSNMEPISERLFAKIRGRFPSVTIGDMNGAVTDNPNLHVTLTLTTWKAITYLEK